MAEVNNVIDSLSVLLDPEGKMKLSLKYANVIDNIQKSAVSSLLKNTELSGDPTSGTVEAKRFVNAKSQEYGTARTAGKGQNVKGKTVTVALDINHEFVEEIEEKDVSLLGVDGFINKRIANQQRRLEAELDEAFFAEAKAEGTKFTPTEGVTEIADIIESAIIQLITLKTDYIDGLDRSMLSVTADPQTYSDMRKYLDTKVNNANVNTSAQDFITYHGVKFYESTRLGDSIKFIAMMDESIAQPIMTTSIGAERIPLSNATAMEMFYSYGTQAVTPETILYYEG